MKIILTAALIFITSFSFAQKKYDCVVRTLDGQKTVGRLFSVSDSSIQLQNGSFDWKNIKVVRFRKHNGFMRTYLPLAVAGAIVFAASISQKDPFISSGSTSDGFGIGFMLGFVGVIGYSWPVYFIFRNHTFHIHSYNDFILLKQASSKYIFK